MDRFARRAVESAFSIVRAVIDEPLGTETRREQGQARLGIAPIYLGTTLAFASVFLYQAACSGGSFFIDINSPPPDTPEVFRSLRQLTDLILLNEDSSASLHPTHPLLSLAKSLETALGGRSHGQSDYPWSDHLGESSGGELVDASFNLDFFPLDEDLFGLNYLLHGEDHHDWMDTSEILGS